MEAISLVRQCLDPRLPQLVLLLHLGLVVLELLVEVFVALQQTLDNVLIDLQRLVQVFVLHQQILILLLQILHLYKPFLKTGVF